MITRPGCLAMIDISAAQPTIDWGRVAAAGISVVAVEVGVGNDRPNSCRVAQVAGARAAGLRVLPYDFAYPLPADGVHPGRDPIAQVALWTAATANLGLDPEPLIVDIEWPPTTSWQFWGVNAVSVRGWLLAALSEAERVTGVTPWVYGSPGFLEAIRTQDEPELGRFPLWLAEWGVNVPGVPAPWAAWAAWQYSSTGHVDGIEPVVDLSWIRQSPDATLQPR